MRGRLRYGTGQWVAWAGRRKGSPAHQWLPGARMPGFQQTDGVGMHADHNDVHTWRMGGLLK